MNRNAAVHRSMRNFFFTYGSVPELAPFSLAKRAEVLRASGGRFGKTPQFMKVWRLGLALSFGVPFLVGVATYFLTESVAAAMYSAVGAGLVGYAIWFNVRINCLRPHIRAYLAEITNAFGKRASQTIVT